MTDNKVMFGDKKVLIGAIAIAVIFLLAGIGAGYAAWGVDKGTVYSYDYVSGFDLKSEDGTTAEMIYTTGDTPTLKLDKDYYEYYVGAFGGEKVTFKDVFGNKSFSFLEPSVVVPIKVANPPTITPDSTSPLISGFITLIYEKGYLVGFDVTYTYIGGVSTISTLLKANFY